ncbi:hypothetical protein MATL_G00198630 [Megalops atlanticus]|uniref:Calponin-homology (CH) domain-containing protein n=1 Tax=Megalops atlanticus TaxID=7932 RepID=A0A9D3PK22_MEGAT|nr:hypothetical protein MATL_G00198630 [Megalops atlanticus]
MSAQEQDETSSVRGEASEERDAKSGGGADEGAGEEEPQAEGGASDKEETCHAEEGACENMETAAGDMGGSEKEEKDREKEVQKHGEIDGGSKESGEKEEEEVTERPAGTGEGQERNTETETEMGNNEEKKKQARSFRSTTKKDILAKFQQNCAETPVVPNFKVQRSSAGFSNGASIKQKVLQWCRNKTRNYEGVCIENFSSSWSDGLAFCALVHRFFPDAFDFSELRAEEREKNFTLAFSTAEAKADCCPLLEVPLVVPQIREMPSAVHTTDPTASRTISDVASQRGELDSAVPSFTDVWPVKYPCCGTSNGGSSTSLTEYCSTPQYGAPPLRQ